MNARAVRLAAGIAVALAGAVAPSVAPAVAESPLSVRCEVTGRDFGGLLLKASFAETVVATYHNASSEPVAPERLHIVYAGRSGEIVDRVPVPAGETAVRTYRPFGRVMLTSHTVACDVPGDAPAAVAPAAGATTPAG